MTALCTKKLCFSWFNSTQLIIAQFDTCSCSIICAEKHPCANLNRLIINLRSNKFYNLKIIQPRLRMSNQQSQSKRTISLDCQIIGYKMRLKFMTDQEHLRIFRMIMLTSLMIAHKSRIPKSYLALMRSLRLFRNRWSLSLITGLKLSIGISIVPNALSFSAKTKTTSSRHSEDPKTCIHITQISVIYRSSSTMTINKMPTMHKTCLKVVEILTNKPC